MGKLIYSITTSLDGYVSNESGGFGWTEPSEEILAFHGDILKNVGTFLLGRRMHEALAGWDTFPSDGPSEAANRFSSIWRAADKIVYSHSLAEALTANTSIEHAFNPDQVRESVAGSDRDFNIGGPHLAAEAIRAEIVDEYHQFIVPLILGGGNRWLPENVGTKLRLADLQKFSNGTVHLQFNKV